MLSALLAAVAAVAVVTAADRLLARIAARRIGRSVQRISAAPDPASVRIAGGPFVVQLLGGRYRAIEVTLGACQAGAVELASLTGTLSQVRAPLRALAHGGSITAGRVTACGTVPLSALARRLPAGLRLSLENGNLRLTGTFLRVPVTGTLGIRADREQIVFTPKITGIPAPVGFVLSLAALPGGLKITAVRPTAAGLELEAAGAGVSLRGL